VCGGSDTNKEVEVSRKLVGVAVLVTVAALLGQAGSASAATWPANCKTFSCVNDRLNRLHNQNAVLANRVANLNAFINQCLVELPITQYTGYMAIDGVTDVPALDFTATGDPIHLWAWGTEPGTCGSPITAKPATSSITTHGFSIRTVVPRSARLSP
jgi:hypothetical protein